jgi:hypothetical protein
LGPEVLMWPDLCRPFVHLSSVLKRPDLCRPLVHLSSVLKRQGGIAPWGSPDEPLASVKATRA